MVLSEVATFSTAGVGAGFGFFVVKWLVEWASSRWDRRADLIDQGTENLIKQLQAQMKSVLDREQALLIRLRDVENSLAECLEHHNKAEKEITRLAKQLQEYRRNQK